MILSHNKPIALIRCLLPTFLVLCVATVQATKVPMSPLATAEPATEQINAVEAGVRPINILILGDGYTTAQMATFDADARILRDNILATPPLNLFHDKISIWTVRAISNVTGAGEENSIDNAFGSTYYGDRYIEAEYKVNVTAAKALIPVTFDGVYVVVNFARYGGGGGQPATGYRGNLDDMFLHEFGHSAYGLADEYSYGDADGIYDGTTEPGQPNITIQSNPQLVKWKEFVGINGTGVFEGAAYCTHGVYRPANVCKMKQFGVGFCEVCKNRIVQRIAQTTLDVPPVAGTINDGVGADADLQASTTTIAANWTGFADANTGIAKYEWAIGTTPFGIELQSFQNVVLATQVANPNLQLARGMTVYVTVRATNGLGLHSSVTSDGILILSPVVGLSASATVLDESGGASSIITATLTKPHTLPVTVTLGTAGTAVRNTDYNLSGTEIVIPAGQTSGTVTLTVTDDALQEGDESAIISITDVVNAVANGMGQVTVTLGDDEVVPVVTTTPVYASISSAGAGGVVQSGTNVTARGVCWGVDPNPTLANGLTVNGTGLGAFTSQITGLQPGTAYHLRAYATNPVGTAYGADVAFMTRTAQAGVWVNPDGGLWTDAGNWSNGAVAGGAGNTADFNTLNLIADATVDLRAPHPIGNLIFGDTTPTHNWFLNATTGCILTLGVPVGVPSITVTNTKTTIGAILAGAQGFTKDGAGTLLLSGANTYSGTTTVSGGTLMLGNAAALGSSTHGSTINGGTLNLNGQALGNVSEVVTVSGTGAAGAGAIINGSATEGSLRYVTLAGDTTINNANSICLGTGATGTTGTLTLNAHTLTKTGAGNLILNGLNMTGAGNLTVSQGTLQLGRDYDNNQMGISLAGTGTLTVNAGASVTTKRWGGSFTLSMPITLAGGTLGSSWPGPNGATIASPITLTANSRLNFNGGYGNTTLSGAITGAYKLTIGGDGATRTLTGANTYSGGTEITVGTVAFNNGSLGAAGNITLNGGGLKWNGTNTQDVSARIAMLAGKTATFDTNGNNVTFAAGIGSGATAALTKSGAGTLTLGGTNTYTGTTTVSAGTLLVTGSLANSATTVAAGATLGGTGTIGGPVANSGTLAPGSNGIGTLTVTNTLGLTGTTAMQLNKAGATLTNDKVQGITTLTQGGTLNITASGDALAAGDTFTLFSATTFAGSGFTVVNPPPLGAGLVWNISQLGVNGTIRVAWVTYKLAYTAGANGTIVGTTPQTVNHGASGTAVTATPNTGYHFVSWSDGPTANLRTDTNVTNNLAVSASFAINNPDANHNGFLDTWEIEKFGNADPGANPSDGDPDHDGLNNLMEYAFNTAPTLANASPLACDLEPIAGSGHLRLTVPKNPAATNLAYTVETCGDLALTSWSAADTTIETTTANQLVVRDNFSTTTATRRFIRLRVTVNP